MAVEVFMPKMSDNMEAGEIQGWLVKEGDHVERGQPILELMTDKVTAELEAPASGMLRGIREGVIEGATVPVGMTIAFIGDADEELPVLAPLLVAGAEGAGTGTSEGSVPEIAPAAPPLETVEAPLSGGLQATPAARRLARELGIDLAVIKAGPEGRIREEDVRAHAEIMAAAQRGADASGEAHEE